MKFKIILELELELVNNVIATAGMVRSQTFLNVDRINNVIMDMDCNINSCTTTKIKVIKEN
jgi:hypothetical protein